jgi:hypothetical protein
MDRAAIARVSDRAAWMLGAERYALMLRPVAVKLFTADGFSETVES